MSVFIQIKNPNRPCLFLYAFFAFGVCLLLSACSHDENTEGINKTKTNDLNESLIKANQAFLEAERSAIDGYIKRRKLVMTESSTGLRYKIEESGSGDKVKTGNLVELKYDVYLLDGTPCYNSDSSGTL